MSVLVAAGRGTVRDAKALVAAARAWAAAQGGEVQLLDAGVVVGPDHLLVAAERAARALAEGRGSSKELPAETILYTSGERQIATAIRKMGVREGDSGVAVIAWGCDPDALLASLNLTRDDALLAATAEKLRRFGITDAELATVPEGRQADLVLERVALVEVLKG